NPSAKHLVHPTDTTPIITSPVICHNSSQDSVGLSFSWAWRRAVWSQAELLELSDLQNMIINLCLFMEQDTWEFTPGTSRFFKVNTMRKIISNTSTDFNSQQTRWNKILPSKVNIIDWRVLLHRLPTRVNLDHRWIDLDSVRCPYAMMILKQKHMFSLTARLRIASGKTNPSAKHLVHPTDTTPIITSPVICHNSSQDSVGLSFSWAWRRAVWSQAELLELSDLQNMIINLCLFMEQDTWEFTPGTSRFFKVNTMRKIISNTSTDFNSQQTRWNKILPSKVNIIDWRVLLHRLPTRVNLDHRWIDLDSVRCPYAMMILKQKHMFSLTARLRIASGKTSSHGGSS
nr:RNA-directed DNA polymerase, eukaryota, reverse transcriptase zinc-binding domain protein [Tanacetum cinerariifolium]